MSYNFLFFLRLLPFHLNMKIAGEKLGRFIFVNFFFCCISSRHLPSERKRFNISKVKGWKRINGSDIFILLILISKILFLLQKL